MANATTGVNQETRLANPKLNAEQALLRLLELIRSSHSIVDFTPERVSNVMGVTLNFAHDGSDRYGFGEAVTSRWDHGFGVDRTSKSAPYFDFSFNERPPSSDPPMTDICQMDFDGFAKSLEAMGFARQTFYGSHGSLGWDQFERPGLLVEVHPRGEANEPSDKISHDCVQMVIIR